jgi:hypothetical protein
LADVAGVIGIKIAAQTDFPAGMFNPSSTGGILM